MRRRRAGSRGRRRIVDNGRRRECRGQTAPRRRKQILQAPAPRARAMSAARVTGRGVRRPRARVSGDRLGAGAGAARQRGRWSRPGSTGARRSRATGSGSPRRRSTQTFPPPRPARRERRPVAPPMRRSRCCRCSSASATTSSSSDILTLAPALAAERAGLRRATLIPHVYPVHEPGLPFFAFGAMPPRTPVGRALWRAALPVLLGGLRAGARRAQRVARAGRARADRAAARRDLRAAWRWWRRSRSSSIRAAGRASSESPGRCAFELPYPDVELPRGRRAAGRWSRRRPRRTPTAGWCGPRSRRSPTSRYGCWRRPTGTRRRSRCRRPRRTRVVVDWLSYTQAMAAADLVLCHGGHGTVARALAAGAPLICCPAVGDMAENGARVAWSGAGLMLPWRLISAASLRLTVRGARRSVTARAGTRDRGLGSRQRRRRARRRAGRATGAFAEELRGWDSNPQPIG